MPLATALPTLQADLIKIFKSQPPTAAEVADKLATAYATYAGNATCAGGSVVIPPTAKDLLRTALFGAIANPLGGLPPVFASAWAAGYTAFWMTPPVPIVGTAIGAVTAAGGSAALIPALTALFANPLNTEEVAGIGLATSLHAATMLVVCSVTIPPAPAVVVAPLL